MLDLVKWIQSPHDMSKLNDDDRRECWNAYTIVANNITYDLRCKLNALERDPYHVYKKVVNYFQTPINWKERVQNRFQFFQLKCSNPENVTKFITKIEQMNRTDHIIDLIQPNDWDELAKMNDPRKKAVYIMDVIGDFDKVVVLLCGLPKEFGELVDLILEIATKNQKKPTYCECKNM